jgi:hypothetical protein
MHRLLFVIPHFHRNATESDLGSETESAEHRSKVLARTITGLHEAFGPALNVFPGHRSILSEGHSIDIAVVTTGTSHLMAQIGDLAQLVKHVETDVAPKDLGFAAHRVLAEGVGRYDGYGYVEDDLLVHDPLLFVKQRWFVATFGSESVLAPNRYEASGGAKIYPDGPLGPEVTAGLAQPPGPDLLRGCWFGLDLTFERPSNPHAGSFFVDAGQLARLAAHPRFGVPNEAFVRTLESAATAALAETFRIYKAARPAGDFLEIEHQGSHYLGMWGIPEDAHVSEAARLAAEARAEDAEARAARAESELASIRNTLAWRSTAPLRRFRGLVRRPGRTNVSPDTH